MKISNQKKNWIEKNKLPRKLCISNLRQPLKINRGPNTELANIVDVNAFVHNNVFHELGHKWKIVFSIFFFFSNHQTILSFLKNTINYLNFESTITVVVILFQLLIHQMRLVIFRSNRYVEQNFGKTCCNVSRRFTKSNWTPRLRFKYSQNWDFGEFNYRYTYIWWRLNSWQLWYKIQ